MATKEEILQGIRTLAEQQAISKEEIDMAYESGGGIKSDKPENKKFGISEILYYIGGAIVFLGIAILLSQNWSTLGFFTKILVTLVAGVAAYIVGVLFSRDERTETVGSAFYLISALVIPMGLYVVFDQAGFDAKSHGTQSLISAILLAMYVTSYFVFKKNIFALFSILFGTWFFFAITSLIVGGHPNFGKDKFYEYRALLVGASYMFLAYSFAKTSLKSLTNFLYGFGIFIFLLAAIILGGWKPRQNMFWELVYPALIFASLYFSVYIKNKSFLTWGTFFLMVYILKITSEYFSKGLGWPFALVLAGLAMIGVSYLSISLKRKYLTNK